MAKRFWWMFFLIPCLAGCSVNSPEELDRLTKEDPAFKQMIVQRDQAHAQMQLIKQDLLGKKRAMDAEIDRLRQGYDVYAKAQNQKIEKYQAAVDANRSKLKQEIEVSNASLGEKAVKLEGYKKTLLDIQKVLKEGKGIHFTPSDRKKWEEQILILSEKIKPLEDEIQDLKLQIRLKKQKIGFLN